MPLPSNCPNNLLDIPNALPLLCCELCNRELAGVVDPIGYPPSVLEM